MIIEIICYWPFYDFSLSGFLLDITCIKPMYTNGWYLQYLVTWYLIFYIVKRVVKPEKWKAILLFCVISAVMFFTMPEIKAEQSLSFLTGIVFSEYYDSQKIRSFFRRWWIGSIFLFIGVVALTVKQTSIIREGPQLLYNLMQLLIKWPCAIGLIILVLCLSERISLRFFLMVGTISYELYIIHGYVFGAVSVSIVGAVLFIMTSVVASSVYWLFISKVLKPVLTKALRVE